MTFILDNPIVGSGQLDFADFSKALLRRWRDPSGEEEKLRHAFEFFDKKKTGFIKIREMCMLLKTSGDGFSLDEIDDFVRFCKSAGITSGDTVDYHGKRYSSQFFNIIV